MTFSKIDFFAETESLWPQGPATRDFWNSYLIWPKYSTFNNFRVWTASNEIYIPRMLSERWNKFRVYVISGEIRSSYAQHILNDDFEMGCDFPLCWEFAKIGYSLTEHARKLVTCGLTSEHVRKMVICWLSMCENWLLGSWAHAKIILAHHMHFQSFRGQFIRA
jgi:hypothetical protein